MPSYPSSLARTLVVLLPVVGAVLVLDHLVRGVALAALPLDGGSARVLGMTLLRADHVAPAWVAEAWPRALLGAGLASAGGLVLPVLVRADARSGGAAALATGLFAGGLAANWRALVADGAVLDLFPLPLPDGRVLVASVGDVAVVAGIVAVALLTLAAVGEVALSWRRPTAAASPVSRACGSPGSSRSLPPAAWPRSRGCSRCSPSSPRSGAARPA